MAEMGTEYAFAEWESCRSWPLNAERQVSARLLPDSAHSANGRIGRDPELEMSLFPVVRNQKNNIIDIPKRNSASGVTSSN